MRKLACRDKHFSLGPRVSAAIKKIFRIAFSAIYLSDEVFPRYMRTLAMELTSRGSLMAIALSGFEGKFIFDKKTSSIY